METKSLFTAITNIIEEEVTQPFSYFEFIFLFQSLAQFLEMQSLVPLSNFALRSSASSVVLTLQIQNDQRLFKAGNKVIIT